MTDRVKGRQRTRPCLAGLVTSLRSNDTLAWVIPVGMSLVAGAAVWIIGYSTHLGPWVFSDSAEYIVSARNLLKGLGLGLTQASGEFQPLSLHPPLYPLVLAGAGFAGFDLITSARWLNAVLFGGTIVVVLATIRLVTNSALLAFVAGIMLLTNPTLIDIHSGAMAEPLFLFAGSVSLLLLLRYFEAPRRPVLLLAALACGLAILTRFPGLAFMGAGLIGLTLFRPGSWKARLEAIGQYAALASAPILLWQLWAKWQLGVEAPRQWKFDVGNLWSALAPFRGELVGSIWNWIPYHDFFPTLPYHPKPRLLFAAGLGIAGLAVIAVQRIVRCNRLTWQRTRSLQLGLLYASFVCLSIGLLAVVFVFSLPQLGPADIDRRMLLPAQVGTLLTILLIADLCSRAWRRQRWIRWLTTAGGILLISWYLPQSLELASDLHRTGGGYTGLGWRNSPTVQAVADLPPETPIVTNESAAISFLLDRAAYDIPELARWQKREEFARFGIGDESEERIFRENGAALVLFDSVFDQFYAIYEARAEERLRVFVDGLWVESRLGDGTIYYNQPSP